MPAGAPFFQQGAELLVKLLRHFAGSFEVGGAEGLWFAVRKKACRVMCNGGRNQSLQTINRFFMRGARVVCRKVQHRKTGLGGRPAQGLKNLLLVAKVVVHKRLGHAQRLHDLLNGGAGVAVAVKQRFGGFQNALALLVRAGGLKLLAPLRSHRCSDGWGERFLCFSGGGSHAGFRVSRSLYRWVVLFYRQVYIGKTSGRESA